MVRARSTSPEPGSDLDVIRTWDARADRYLRLFRHELDRKPFDQVALSEFAKRVGVGGMVCDAGCGSCGHVSALLADRGLDVLGIDLSARCIELARREQPGCRFEVMDQRAIKLAAPGQLFDGLVSYYSLHDQPKRELADTLVPWAAAIRPGGQLLVVVKEGTGDGVIDDPLGSEIQVYWAEFTAPELCQAAEAAAFHVDALITREAYEDEIPSRRIYLSATRL